MFTENINFIRSLLSYLCLQNKEQRQKKPNKPEPFLTYSLSNHFIHNLLESTFPLGHTLILVKVDEMAELTFSIYHHI